MKSHSCFENPPRENIVILRQWHVRFCQGNHCAAALLSYFDYWHSIKLEQSKKSNTANDVAEMHGDGRTQDESLFQFHSNDELQESLLGIYGKTKISESLKYLVKRNAISIHRNPNPRYKFDNTNHFLLNTGRLEKWLKAYKKHVLLKMNGRRSEISDGLPKISDGRLKTVDGRLKMNEQYPVSSSVSSPLSSSVREGEKPPTHQNGFSKKPAVSQSTGAQKKLEYNPDILANPENYTAAEIRNEAGNLAEKYVQEVFAPAWTLKTGQPYIPTFGDVAERMLAALFESCISRKINIADLFRARLNNFFNSNTGYYKDRRYSLKTFCEDFNTLTEPKHDKKQSSGWVTC